MIAFLAKVPERVRILFAIFYTLLLTWELLLVDPWTLFGQEMAIHPPVDITPEPISFLVHLTAYFGVAFLYVWATQSIQIKYRGYVLGFAAIHAAGCELLQYFVPNRWPSISDVLGNISGLALGYMVTVLILNKSVEKLAKLSEPIHP